MRWILVLGLCVLGTTSRPAGAEPGASVAESRIVITGVPFTLRSSVREATLGPSHPGSLTHYTVRRDGELLYPREPEGGRLVGCTYSRCEPARHHAVPFPDAKAPIGWLLSTGAICGNTHSLKRRIVIPHHGDSSYPRSYEEITFTSKSDLTLRRSEAGLEVWGTWQDWGAGGTATSVFVPFRIVIAPDGTERRPPLPDDPATWPTTGIESGPMGWFVAGVRQRNANILRATLAAWTDFDEHADWREGFGLPREREGLLEIIAAVEAATAAEDRLDALTKRWR